MNIVESEILRASLCYIHKLIVTRDPLTLPFQVVNEILEPLYQIDDSKVISRVMK